MIKTVIFDMGGVIITLDENKAGKRFVELGMKEFAEKMDPYKQVGLNGQLEEGKISEEEYRRMVSEKLGREVSFEELQHCWLGYMKEVPARNLHGAQKTEGTGLSRGSPQQYQSLRVSLGRQRGVLRRRSSYR